MVFYFKARPDAGDYTIYMGADKNENEELIKYGLPEDVWFHVDKVSSAHVYLRLKKGETIDTISEGLLEDCAQLVKAHSIQGNKMNNVEVIYTPWCNLKKSPSMDVGQVGFHNPRMVISRYYYSYHIPPIAAMFLFPFPERVRKRKHWYHFNTWEREHSRFRDVDVSGTWNMRTGTWGMFPFPGC